MRYRDGHHLLPLRRLELGRSVRVALWAPAGVMINQVRGDAD